MKFNRAAGILLHPSSLPGPDGIGDIGPEAYHWVNFLKETGCSLWQVLPLGPTGYGDLPYQCFSAFAGNPYLINPLFLMEDDLISQEDLDHRPDFNPQNVDFGKVIDWKISLLVKAFNNFQKMQPAELMKEFSFFKDT